MSVKLQIEPYGTRPWFGYQYEKRYMVIYDAEKPCVFEIEIKHSKPELKNYKIKSTI